MLPISSSNVCADAIFRGDILNFVLSAMQVVFIISDLFQIDLHIIWHQEFLNIWSTKLQPNNAALNLDL